MKQVELKRRRSVWEMYNDSRNRFDGLDFGQIKVVDGVAHVRYRQDLGGIVSMGSMKDELDKNGNNYEVAYLPKSVTIKVYDPLAVTPENVVSRNLGKYPKGVFKRV